MKNIAIELLEVNLSETNDYTKRLEKKIEKSGLLNTRVLEEQIYVNNERCLELTEAINILNYYVVKK